jgi:hypothetical protein
MSKVPTVREYISPIDSATVLDYLVEELGFPKDIHKEYSEKIAPMPINFGEIPSNKDTIYRGRYDRIPVGNIVFEGAHSAIDTLMGKNWMGTKWDVPYTSHIRVDSTKTPDYEYLGEASEMEHSEKLMDIPMFKDWHNTLIHEALGHALFDKMTGYRPKEHPEGILSGRGELLPHLIQTIATQNRETPYPEIEKNVIKVLEPLVKSELDKARK